MKAARIHKFGPPSVIVIDEVSRPAPGPGEILVRVNAAGVGPWDALIREGKSVVESPLPLILGSDLAGTIVEIGPEVSEFKPGDMVYGVTNQQFIGAYAEYALATSTMIALKPKSIDEVAAASIPVIAVTAWQMLFDYAKAKKGQSVLILGGAGNVGAYAVQLASQAGLQVTATASTNDVAYVQSLGAVKVIDWRTQALVEEISAVDIVLDTVGADMRDHSIKVLKKGGILVSIVSPFPEGQRIPGIQTVFFIVQVSTTRLHALGELIDRGKLKTQVGTVLKFEEVQKAHEMLAGAPHKRGKIVLTI